MNAHSGQNHLEKMVTLISNPGKIAYSIVIFYILVLAIILGQRCNIYKHEKVLTSKPEAALDELIRTRSTPATVFPEKVVLLNELKEETKPTANIAEKDRDHAINRTGTNTERNDFILVPAASHVSSEDAFKEEMLMYKDKLSPHCFIRATQTNIVNETQYDAQEIYANCSSQRVPGIVHFVWLWAYPEPYTFRQLLGGLSVLRVLKPCAIYFWNAGYLPTGEWWDMFVGNATESNTTFLTLNITTPMTYAGTIYREAHKSDLVRIHAIKYFGGIYLDFDIIILNPFTPLLCYDMVLGRLGKPPAGLPNALMIAVPNATFINLWIDAYNRNFRRMKLSYNSVTIPRIIHDAKPGLIHVEESSIHIPSYRHIIAIFGAHYDWQNQYAVHLWNNHADSKPRNINEKPKFIRNMNSAFGEIARWVYFEMAALNRKPNTTNRQSIGDIVKEG